MENICKYLYFGNCQALVNIAVIFHVAIHSEANRANSKTHVNNFRFTMPFICHKMDFNATHLGANFRGWFTD